MKQCFLHQSGKTSFAIALCFSFFLLLQAGLESFASSYPSPGGCMENIAGEIITNLEELSKTSSGAICEGQTLLATTQNQIAGMEDYEWGYVLSDTEDVYDADYLYFSTDGVFTNDGSFPQGIVLYLRSAVLAAPFALGDLTAPCSDIGSPVMLKFSEPITVHISQDCLGDKHQISFQVSPDYEVITGIEVNGQLMGPGPVVLVDIPDSSITVTASCFFGDCFYCQFIELHPLFTVSAVQVGCDEEEGGTVLLTNSGGSGTIGTDNFHLSINWQSFHYIENASISHLPAGLQSLCVMDGESGCVTCTDVQISTPPTAPLTEMVAICPGEETVITVSNPLEDQTYNWYINNELQASHLPGFPISAANMEAVIEVSASKNGCESSRSLFPLEVVPAVAVEGYGYACSEDYKVIYQLFFSGAENYVSPAGEGSFDGNAFIIQTDATVLSYFSFYINTPEGLAAGCSDKLVEINTSANCMPALQAFPDSLGTYPQDQAVVINTTTLLANDSGIEIAVSDIYVCQNEYNTTGTVLQDEEGWTYIPADGYTGLDTLCYTITDAFGQTSSSYIVIELENNVPCDFIAEIAIDCFLELSSYNAVIALYGMPYAIYEMQISGPGNTINTITTADGDGLVVTNAGPFEIYSNAELQISISLMGAPGCTYEYAQIISCGPYPIALIQFSGHPEPAYNFLSWSTASENAVDYFSIERSEDEGHSWEETAKVAAAGNSYIRNDYEVIDDNKLAPSLMYRLIEYDIYGQRRIAGEVVHILRDHKDGAEAITLLNDRIIVSGYSGKIQLEIYNAAGTLVNYSGNADGTLFLDNLPGGIYFIVCKTEQGRLVKNYFKH